jgi:hypothetical protein
MEAGVNLLRTKRNDRPFRRAAGAMVIALGALGAVFAGSAQASEGGASFYLLGVGGPEAGIAPPLQGVYYDNTFYYYDGSASGSKEFQLGGQVVADVHAKIAADFNTLLWVPSTHFLGGTPQIGAVVPFGSVQVNASAILTGPLGNPFDVSRSDSTFVVGDPVATVGEGWKLSDKAFVNLVETVNVPVGQYNEGALANLSFHRWAGDTSLAGSWHDAKAGWDLSAKAGITFNGSNHYTQYTTGTEFHIEGSIEKQVSKQLAIAAQVYYFDQLTGDSGTGDKLGPFKGQVTGVGGTAAYTFMAGRIPVKLRGRVMTEFDATNRLTGTSGWLDVTMPLWVKLPTAPPPH